MKITDEAKQYIQALLKEQQVGGLRIDAIEGCCGPQIALSLDSLKESDNTSIINGISVAIAQQANGIIGDLTLDFETEGEQSRLVMIGAPNNC